VFIVHLKYFEKNKVCFKTSSFKFPGFCDKMKRNEGVTRPILLNFVLLKSTGNYNSEASIFK